MNIFEGQQQDKDIKNCFEKVVTAFQLYLRPLKWVNKF